MPRKIDDRLMGRQQELAIHVITPFHDHAENPTVLRAQAMGRDEVLLLLPPNDRFIRELLMFKRTDKYVRQISRRRSKAASNAFSRSARRRTSIVRRSCAP